MIRVLCCALMCLALVGFAQGDEPVELREKLAPFARPPKEFAEDFGDYRSLLKFNNGEAVKTVDNWRRREELISLWEESFGKWPNVVDSPKVEFIDKSERGSVTQHRVRIVFAPDRTVDNAYLSIPNDAAKPLPAALVVFYEAKSSVGQRDDGQKSMVDWGSQLAQRGFVTLSIGSPNNDKWPSAERSELQPLWFLAFVAARCHEVLAQRPEVDPKRIGIIGHSYGSKWAMFASCFYEKFACAVWCDGGIVFDEKRPNVNYWEPWYLGLDPATSRKPGVPSESNPRTGPYKKLIEQGHNLHELMALMAPRPFLVSGGSEDPPERWRALNHVVQVNDLLGAKDRVYMTNRPGHTPTDESNEQIHAFFELHLKR